MGIVKDTGKDIEGKQNKQTKKHLHTLRNEQKFCLKVTGKHLAITFKNSYFCNLGPNGHCYF